MSSMSMAASPTDPIRARRFAPAPVPAPSAHPHAPEGDGEHRRTARAQSHVVRSRHVQDLRSDFEVAPALEIGDETRLVWAPSKPLSRLRARGRKVEREETREPGEVRGGL